MIWNHFPCHFSQCSRATHLLLSSNSCLGLCVSFAFRIAQCMRLHDLVFGRPSHWVLGLILMCFNSDFICLNHAMFGCKRCSAFPLLGLVCVLFCTCLCSMFWPHSMHVLALFWPPLGLFWITLALWGLVDMAMVQVPWLALSFKSINMLCLS